MGRHLGIDFLRILVDFWTQVRTENARKIGPRQAKTGQDKGRQRKGREGRGKEERDRNWKGKRIAAVNLSKSALRKPVEDAPKEQPRRQTRRISKAKRNNQMNKHNSRARRLNRSRHMEYKYEMRALLKEIEVSPEHHSVLLGTIWAKGERQDVKSAKEFVRERKDAGAINDEQMERLISLIDDYTTRR